MARTQTVTIKPGKLQLLKIKRVHFRHLKGEDVQSEDKKSYNGDY